MEEENKIDSKNEKSKHKPNSYYDLSLNPHFN